MSPLSAFITDQVARIWAGIQLHYLIAFVVVIGTALIAFAFVVALLKSANNAARESRAEDAAPVASHACSVDAADGSGENLHSRARNCCNNNGF